MSFKKDLKDLDEFKRFSGAHSPPRPEFESMSAEQLEDVLGANIPRAPSWTDRARGLIGMKSPIRYDPSQVRIAKLMAQSKHDRTKKNKERHEAEINQRYNDEQLKEERRLAQIRYEQEAARDRKETEKRIEAAKARAKFPRYPITQEQLRDAKGDYENLRWDA